MLFIAGLLIHSQFPVPTSPEYGTISEDTERAIYIMQVSLLIPVGLLSSWLVKTFAIDARHLGWRPPAAIAAMTLLLVCTLFLEMPGAPQTMSFRWSFAATTLAIALIYLKLPAKHWRRARSPKLFIALGGLLCFCAISFRIYSANSVEYSFAMISHLEAVFYSVTQATAGKAALVNFSPQYGLYAEYFAPIFQIIGISVLKFTLAMAALQSAAVLMILWLIFQVIASNTMRVLCIGSLALLINYTFQAPNDAYFQYFPLRFLFPVIATTLYFSYIKKPSLTKLVALGIIGALAIPFNLDSGIPVFGSLFAAFLFTWPFAKREDRAARFRELAIFTFCAIFTSAAFVALIYSKSPILDWSLLVI